MDQPNYHSSVTVHRANITNSSTRAFCNIIPSQKLLNFQRCLLQRISSFQSPYMAAIKRIAKVLYIVCSAINYTSPKLPFLLSCNKFNFFYPDKIAKDNDIARATHRYTEPGKKPRGFVIR